tara:strand:+ start:207 stop:665 length:459 start_codon:yes stop_codon:yes gene_type:complete
MYQLKATQLIHADITTCWNFFSTPNNLKKITPEYMGFEVLTDLPEIMYEGLMIEYRVKPILNIPTKWVTKISKVEEKKYFVDEQWSGPYKQWHHEHHFKTTKEGTEMTDILTYQMPFGILGKLLHALFIKNKLKSIFKYRHQAVEQIFNKTI